MNIDDIWFCVTFGGAGLIMLIGGLYLRQKFPRIKSDANETGE